jgi:hypothetical protein
MALSFDNCYNPFTLTVPIQCSYSVIEIRGTDCLNDSINYLNSNFTTLCAAECSLNNIVQQRLQVLKDSYYQFYDFKNRVPVYYFPNPANPNANKNIRDTFILGFSGAGIFDVQEIGVMKTVYIPTTGVTGIRAGRNIRGFSIEQGTFKQYDGGGCKIILNSSLTQSPVQHRTFFYTGPDGPDNTSTKPSLATISTFINTTLDVPSLDRIDPRFSGGVVYVVYQKTGYQDYTVRTNPYIDNGQKIDISASIKVQDAKWDKFLGLFSVQWWGVKTGILTKSESYTASVSDKLGTDTNRYMVSNFIIYKFVSTGPRSVAAANNFQYTADPVQSIRYSSFLADLDPSRWNDPVAWDRVGSLL